MKLRDLKKFCFFFLEIIFLSISTLGSMHEELCAKKFFFAIYFFHTIFYNINLFFVCLFYLCILFLLSFLFDFFHTHLPKAGFGNKISTTSEYELLFIKFEKNLLNKMKKKNFFFV